MDVYVAALVRAYDACPTAARALLWARAAREHGLGEQAHLGYEIVLTHLSASREENAEAQRGLEWKPPEGLIQTKATREAQALQLEAEAEEARRRGDLPTMHLRFAQARNVYRHVRPSPPPRGFVRSLRFTNEGLRIVRSGGAEQLDDSGNLRSRNAACRDASPRGYGFPISECDGEVTIHDTRGWADASDETALASGTSADERWLILSTRKGTSPRTGTVMIVGLADPVTGELFWLKATEPPELLALSADGRWAATVNGTRLALWQRPSVQPPARDKQAPRAAPTHGALVAVRPRVPSAPGPRPEQPATSRHAPPSSRTLLPVRRANAPRRTVPAPRPVLAPTRTITLPSNAVPPLDVAVSSEGRTVATVAPDGALSVFQQGRWRSVTLREPARAVTFSPDNRVIATVDAAGNVERFALPGLNALSRLGSRTRPDAGPSPPPRDVRSIAYDETGTRIAAGSIDGSVRVWTGEALAIDVPGHAEVQGLEQVNGEVVITSFLTEWRAPLDDLARLAPHGAASRQAVQQNLRIQDRQLRVEKGLLVGRDSAGAPLYTLHLLTDGGYYAVQHSGMQLGGSASKWVAATTQMGLRPWALAEDRWQTNLLGGEREPLYRSDEELDRHRAVLAKRPVLCGTATCAATTISFRHESLPACCASDGTCGVDLSHVTYPISLSRAGCVPLNAHGTPDGQCAEHVQSISGLRLYFAGCRRLDGSCGHLIDVAGVNLGCTDLVDRLFEPQAHRATQ